MTGKIPPLKAHQKESVKFLAKNKRVFDTSDAGTGKTPVHITDFANRRRKKGGRALVLCLKTLIKTAWGNDFKTFAPDIKVSLAFATNRDVAFKEDADAYVTNIDAAVWLSKQKPSFFAKFDTLIIDESTAIKHHTSARSRAVAKIRKYFEYRRLLTGTPSTNGICDIHHQVYIVDDGARLGVSFHAFRNATCIPTKVGFHQHAIKWTDKPGIEAVVGALIQDITISHRFEDCVDIPPNYQYAVTFQLNNKHRKLYDQLERDSSLALRSGKRITAINGAVLYGKLLQCASGATYTDEDRKYALLDTERTELISDLIEQRKHSVVFFTWRHQRDELITYAKKEKWPYAVIDGDTKDKDRGDIVAAYQRGEYKVLYAHPQSAGHGITLTRGTTSIFASPTPNLEHFLQGYKRIYRMTQTEKTETIMVVAENTIDERVWAACQAKNVNQSELLNYLRN